MNLARHPIVRRAVTIRPGRPADADAIARMAQAVERETRSDFPGLTAEHLLRDAFGADPVLTVLVAVPADTPDVEPVGCALLTDAYDVGYGHRGMRLETLYVHRPWRGGTVGRSLLAAVCARVVACGGTYMLWDVQRGQPKLEAYYRRLGGRPMDIVAYALWGNALERLAAEGRAVAGDGLA